MTPVVWDTSALTAILLDEDEGIAFSRLLATARPHLLSAVSWLELSIVMTCRLGPVGSDRIGALVQAGGIQVTPFDSEQARAARSAYEAFGKGRYLAGLNFGDCASYGLAIRRGADLAYKGDDFARTDIRSALAR